VERLSRIGPRTAFIRRTAAMIDGARLQLGDGCCHPLTIQEIDRVPRDALVRRAVLAGRRASWVCPGRDVRLESDQMFDEVAACEASGAGDEWRTTHGRVQLRRSPYCA
jgi:hypothetical protein